MLGLGFEYVEYEVELPVEEKSDVDNKEISW